MVSCSVVNFYWWLGNPLNLNGTWPKFSHWILQSISSKMDCFIQHVHVLWMLILIHTAILLKCDRQRCCLSKVYFLLNSVALCLAVLYAKTHAVWMAPKRVAVYVDSRQSGSSLRFWTELISAVCSVCYVTALFGSPLLIFGQCRIWRAQISGLNLMPVCHALFGLKQSVCVSVCVIVLKLPHDLSSHTYTRKSCWNILLLANSTFSSTHSVTSQAYKWTQTFMSKGDSAHTVVWVINSDFKIPVSCWSPLCNIAHVYSLRHVLITKGQAIRKSCSSFVHQNHSESCLLIQFFRFTGFNCCMFFIFFYNELPIKTFICTAYGIFRNIFTLLLILLHLFVIHFLFK